MDPIWSHLPNDLVLKIVGHLEDIDIRVAFKITPRRLKMDKNFQFRNEIVYDPVNRNLFEFENKILFVRKNINFSVIRPGPLYIFNMEWEPYNLIIYTENCTMGPIQCFDHIVLHKNVKFLLRYGPRDMGEITNRIGA
jgi:hypothetical protein